MQYILYVIVMELERLAKFLHKAQETGNYTKSLILTLHEVFHLISYPKVSVAEVASILNSPTGTPLAATSGANIAAGYTTDEVPTIRHRSQAFSSCPSQTKFKSISYINEKCDNQLVLII